MPWRPLLPWVGTAANLAATASISTAAALDVGHADRFYFRWDTTLERPTFERQWEQCDRVHVQDEQ